MQRITTGYDSRAMIWAYNHLTNTESANYDLRSVGEVSGDTDNHPAPSVIVADDGHILVAQEFPRIGLGNHNDAITIKRSDNAEDETSWVNAKAETAGYWTFIGTWQPDNSARLAYPIFHKDNNGYIYVICRRYDGDGRYNRIYKSTDHGVSWDSGHDIVDGGAGIWMYPIAVLSGTSDTLRFAIYKQIRPSTYDKVFYLESDDGGITWRDISSSFSKDTVASGAITLAELENGAYDFEVASKTDLGKLGVAVKKGTINETGNPFLLTVDWDAGFTNADYRMTYWDGDSWENSIIKGGLAINSSPALIHKSGNTFECYIEDVANQLSLYKTVDLSTWVKVRDVKTTAGLTANTFAINEYTNNYKDAEYGMLIGIYGTHADYSDIFIEVETPKIFEGYVIPDMYYEPFTFPPYPITLRATDGLGDLKNRLFESGVDTPYTGQQDLLDIIEICLDETVQSSGSSPVQLAKFPLVMSSTSDPASSLIGIRCHDPLICSNFAPIQIIISTNTS